MMTALHEAGWVAWLAVAAMAVGLVLVGVAAFRAGRPAAVATAWSVVVMVVAFLNTSVGQRKVDAHVQQEPDVGTKIAMLSLGTREASSNLFVGGACALLLMTAGGLLGLRRAAVDQVPRP